MKFQMRGFTVAPLCNRFFVKAQMESFIRGLASCSGPKLVFTGKTLWSIAPKWPLKDWTRASTWLFKEKLTLKSTHTMIIEVNVQHKQVPN